MLKSIQAFKSRMSMTRRLPIIVEVQFAQRVLRFWVFTIDLSSYSICGSFTMLRTFPVFGQCVPQISGSITDFIVGVTYVGGISSGNTGLEKR